MKPLYIFDLDGTLALIEHRRHFVEGKSKDWKAFYAACVDDKPNIPVIGTLMLLSVACDIWVWSGRSDEVRHNTWNWLTVNLAPIKVMSLKMREENDYTPDDQLKQSWLLGMSPEDRFRLVAVFDDRDKVVKMWREEGVTCFQVAPGDF